MKKAQEIESSENSSIKDDQLLDLVQKQTIDYFWNGAEPTSGMAPERIHMDGIYPQDDEHIVTTGGSGFGFMAILSGVERGWISREAALDHFVKAVSFLENADRFHGAWSHWIDGQTGRVKPFSPKDDGGDLVETAFMMQGLLTVAEYYRDGKPEEKILVDKIERLWRTIEWNWYTQGEDVLYWHWSPNYGWQMDFAVGGYNECLIMYILAAASPTYPIEKKVYDKGWARDGKITEDTSFLGYRTILDHYEHDTDPVGPLFWAHYSYLGLDPRKLSDQYANYWELNTNHAKIHHTYCTENPKDFAGYSDSCWGLTSSYSMGGYKGHHPGDLDKGVIAPTAALSSMPYTPNESLAFLHHLYSEHQEYIGEYGPYDAFSVEHDWFLPRYLAIDQGPIPVMIENYRSGLLWDLFMSRPDIQIGLEKLGFTKK